MYSTRWSAEAGFARVTIYQAKFTPHGDSRARLFAFVHNKGAIIETEIVIIFWKDPKLLNKNDHLE